MNFHRIQEQLQALKNDPHDESPVVRMATALGHELPWFRSDQLEHFATILTPYEGLADLNDDELAVGRAVGALRIVAERVRQQLETWDPNISIRSASNGDQIALAKRIHKFAHEAGEMDASEVETALEEVADLAVVRAVSMLLIIRREIAAAISSQLSPRARVVARPTLELVTAICEQYRHMSSEAVALKCLRDEGCAETLSRLYDSAKQDDEAGRPAQQHLDYSDAEGRRLLTLLSHGFIEIDSEDPSTYRLSNVGKAAGAYLQGNSKTSKDVDKPRMAPASAATMGQFI